MDEEQLSRQYQQDTMYMVNPPSFATWLSDRQRKEEYYKNQERIASHPPDEDEWNK